MKRIKELKILCKQILTETVVFPVAFARRFARMYSGWLMTEKPKFMLRCPQTTRNRLQKLQIIVRYQLFPLRTNGFAQQKIPVVLSTGIFGSILFQLFLSGTATASSSEILPPDTLRYSSPLPPYKYQSRSSSAQYCNITDTESGRKYGS